VTAPGSVEDLQDTFLRSVHLGHDGLAQWAATRLDAADEADRARLRDVRVLAVSARWYASLGLPVFPLSPGTKLPLPKRMDCCWGSHTRGCLDALSNVDAVEHWWRAHPTANIGLATGHVLDVIDVDGPDGWRNWLDGCDWPPVLGSVSTPRPGGVHRFIRRTGARNGQKIAPGIDYRGAGGYVVAPPSWVRTPDYAGTYSWLQPLRMPAR
jgi:hypothetical protein